MARRQAPGLIPITLRTRGRNALDRSGRRPSLGSLDPWLKDQTRVVEKRYKELGGKITVLVTEGEGHFPLSRKDPKPVVDFILSHQRQVR
jgi:hypothetical protein